MTYNRFDQVEIALEAVHAIPANPFTDVNVSAVFSSPTGTSTPVAGFYDGDRTWRIRFTPAQPGSWTYRITSSPADPGLSRSGAFEVTDSTQSAGFLRADPDRGWGLHFDSGQPLHLVGDTQYNLFGAAHSGLDVEGMLCRRWNQGFNTIRARIAVSPFHPNTPFSDWMAADCWLWGGSPQCPDFTRFNLRYLRTVDAVFRLAGDLGMGIELIIEAWLMEFPFNDRKAFLPEFEELMIRTLMARLAAFPSLYIIDPANEYNLHLADRNSPLNDAFALRLARCIRAHDPYRHPIGIHVTAAERMDPPFQDRFRHNPEVDILLMQTWGAMGSQEGISLCLGLEDDLTRSVIGSGKVNILAEYGYEAMPLSTVGLTADAVIDESHSRRGALKAAFMGLHVMQGFQTTWGPEYTRDGEAPGAAWFATLKELVHEVLDFPSLHPRPDLIHSSQKPAFVLADEGPSRIAVYLPEGGDVNLTLPRSSTWRVEHLAPRTLEPQPHSTVSGKRIRLEDPHPAAGKQLPADRILLLTKTET